MAWPKCATPDATIPQEHGFISSAQAIRQSAFLSPSASFLLGGSLDDRAFGLALDSAGNAWVTGHTLSTNFPVTKDALQGVSHGYKGPSTILLPGGYAQTPFGFGDAFVAELGPNGKLLYGTYLGGSDDDVAFSVALSSQGYLFVVGNTMSADFPVFGNPEQPKFGGYSEKTSLLFGDAFMAIFQVPQVSPAPAPPTPTPAPTPTPPPTPTPSPITVTSVGNAASQAQGGVAPDEIVLISGSGIGPPAQVVGAADSATGLLSTSLGGASVSFDGVAAPLVNASATQVTAIVP